MFASRQINGIRQSNTASHFASITKSNLLASRSSNQKVLLKNYTSNNSNFDCNHQHSDFELVGQFELRRQREKTRILQQRLFNKETFIQQMKQYQEELIKAFEKCQEELFIAKQKLQQQEITEMGQSHQIADLKHLVIKLEDQIIFRDRKRDHPKHKSSVKPHYEEHQELKQYFMQNNNQKDKGRNVGKSKRSKTLMNREEEEATGSFKDSLQEELIRDSNKITKFIKQFLMMRQCFLPQIEKGSLKHRLKLAWKWIKTVVKQWNQSQQQSKQFEHFIISALQKINVSPSSTTQQNLYTILKHIKI